MDGRDLEAYSRAGILRLAVSTSAKLLSDAAADLVPIRSSEREPVGHLTAQADQLVKYAQDLLELAVLAEREGRSSWTEIGAALGVSRQAAHERFSSLIEGWRLEFQKPWGRAVDGGQLRESVRVTALDPIARALELDQWVTRRRDGAENDANANERPVSGNLPRASLAEEESRLLAQLTAVTEAARSSGALGSNPGSLRETRVGLLERLAALRPDAPAYAEAAAHARRQLRRTQRAAEDPAVGREKSGEPPSNAAPAGRRRVD